MGKERRKQYGRLRMDTGQHRRVMLTAFVLGIAAFVPMVAQLYSLMVVQYDYYSALALRNQTRSTAVTADRGTIYDRNLNILAFSENRENVYLDPHELKQSKADIPAIASFLSGVLDKDADWIVQQAGDLRRRYKQVGSCIPEETAAQIRDYIQTNNVSGIHISPPLSGSTPAAPWRPRSSALLTPPTRAPRALRPPTTAIFPAVREGSSPPRAITKWICPSPLKGFRPPKRERM